MELRDYLARIGYSGEVMPTVTVLRNLHRQHMYAVPFENLDIALHREIVLDTERIHDKLVRDRRGGFCYEQNTLFAWALRTIGFRVEMLSGGVARPDGSYSPDFDHMCLLVRLPDSHEPERKEDDSDDDNSWLADVGFGDSFVEPLPFVLDDIHEERGWEYQIKREGERNVLRRRRSAVDRDNDGRDDGERNNHWKPQYQFTLTPRQLPDYKPMCIFHQTSPLSHFTQNRICSRATPTGRVTLTGSSIIVTQNGTRNETPVGSPAEFERLLKQQFGIALTGFSAAIT